MSVLFVYDMCLTDRNMIFVVGIERDSLVGFRRNHDS